MNTFYRMQAKSPVILFSSSAEQIYGFNVKGDAAHERKQVKRHIWFFLIPAGMLIITLLLTPTIKAEEAGPKTIKGSPPAELFNVLKPLAKAKREPGPYDWLSQHEEEGQTFDEYVSSNPIKPNKYRKHLYILLLGEFSEKQSEILTLTAEYMQLYFNMEVKFTEPVPLSDIPREATRKSPQTNKLQLHTGYILEKVLYPKLPKDAVAYIAFTATDLWPGEGWNFVYGMAALKARVGVWSIARNGDPAASDKHYTFCLNRTIKIGTHETGHMLSMLHCTAYECNMNGSNHQAELDQNSMWLCPVCLRKLCYATQADPIKRYTAMIEFFKRNKMEKRAEKIAEFKQAMEAAEITRPE